MKIALVWADDDRALYRQVVEGTRAEALTYRHDLITKNEKPSPSKDPNRQ